MISIVLPCLNEQDAIVSCIDNAISFLRQVDLPGEIIVIDNGSTDKTKILALETGVLVLDEPVQGYGHALKKGLIACAGDIIFMMDCDGSYNLLDAKPFINLLATNYDFVIGSRLKGKIHKGAMPWSHLYIGVPALTRLLTFLINLDISDAHCGLRAIRRDAISRMKLSCGGMEFASEMLLEAAKASLCVAEVPVSYMPRIGKSKLKTIQDGFRHLFLIISYFPYFIKNEFNKLTN